MALKSKPQSLWEPVNYDLALGKQQREDFNKINSKNVYPSKTLADLLYNIAFCSDIVLTEQQLNHIGLKRLCDKGKHYMVVDCPSCFKRHFLKTPCGSFFCRECRNYLTSRIKRNARKYLWKCNHFYITFTLPPEIQEKVYAWDVVKDIKQKKVKSKSLPSFAMDYEVDEEGYFYFNESKNIYATDLVYKSVDGALKEYCKKHNLKTGYITLPHSYGSENLNWFFHLNVLISSKAFQQSNIVDYQINFNEIRAIYKKHLQKNFKVAIKDIPQVRFAKKNKSIYIPYKKAINILINYFRHLPLSMKNIKSIKDGRIQYQTYKQQKKQIVNSSTFKEFFHLLTQHIPPKYFRTVRAYGLYSNHSKQRKDYPKGKIKPLKPLKCSECKTELNKDDFIGRIHNGELVWINPLKINQVSIFFVKSILDHKDFEGVEMPEIQPNGRLMVSCKPPPDLIPPTKVEFPPKLTEFPNC